MCYFVDVPKGSNPQTHSLNPQTHMAFLTAEKIQTIKDSRSGGGYFATKTIPDNEGVKVRFLGNAINGVGGWRDGKPVRFEIRPKRDEFDLSTLDPTRDFNTKEISGPGKLKDFIAAVLWNYSTESIQIFEITQVSIQDAMIALLQNEDWGDVTQYDVTIQKIVKSGRTDYKLLPSPNDKGKLSKTIEKAFDETFVDLTKLYSGEDPFKAG